MIKITISIILFLGGFVLGIISPNYFKNQFGISMLTGILSGLIATFIYQIFVRMYDKWRFRSKLWHPFLKDSTIITYGVWQNDYIGKGDLWPILIPLVTIWTYGSQINKNQIPLKRANDCNGSDRENNNLILIGGPASNSLITEALNGTNIQYNKITEDNYSIVANGTTYQRNEDTQNSLLTDYGVCVLRRSPWNNNKWVLSISGTSSHASEGIAKFIRNLAELKRLTNYMRLNEAISLAIVLKTTFKNQCYVQSEIVFSLYKKKRWWNG